MSLEQYWILVLLAFARTVSFIFFLPFFRNSGFPNMCKIAISLGIAMFAAYRMDPIPIENVWHFTGLFLLEFMAGLILAYVVEMMVSVVRIAGSFIDIDIGLSNPFMDINQGQTTLVSSLFYSMFVLSFLLLDGFNEMLSGFIYSFGLDLSKQFLFGGDLINFILETFTYMFFGALQISLPFMMATFLVNLAMLLMSKSVDKINILLNVFGVKILVGLALIFVATPTLMIVFQQLNDSLIEKFFETMNYMFQKKP